MSLLLMPGLRAVVLLAALLRYEITLAQSLESDQYIHRSWTAEQGAPADIWAITQGQDGLLWLGTGSGLFRFDGITFEPLKNALGVETPSSNVTAIGTAPDGAIWIGYYYGGVSVLEKNALTDYRAGAEVPDGSVLGFAWGPDGAVWAASWGGLLRFYDGRWQKIGREWNYPSNRAYFVLEGMDGTIWVTTGTELVFLRPGATKFETTGEAVSEYAAIAQSVDGQLWLSDEMRGTRALPSSKQGVPVLTKATTATTLHSKRILLDRSGNLWGTLTGQGGAYRITEASRFADGRSLTSDNVTESFQKGAGVPSNINVPVYEDREGTIWIGSNFGLTSFRARDVRTLSGILIQPDSDYAMAASAEGGVWIANQDRLLEVHANRYDVVRTGLPDIQNIAVGADNLVWLLGSNSLFRWRSGRLEKLSYSRATAGSNAVAASADANEGLWASFRYEGLLHFGAGGWSSIRVPRIVESLTPTALASRGDSSVWVGYSGGRILQIKGSTSKVFAKIDGLDIGTVTVIEQGRDQTLAGGEFGIASFRDNHWRSWRADEYDFLRGVSGLVETATDLWVNGSRGIVRISLDTFNASDASIDSKLTYHLFDFYDGLPGAASQAAGFSTAMLDSAGRVWFATNQGPVWIDPIATHANNVPPVTSILRLSTETKRFPVSDGVVLPEGTSNVRFDFTAGSLAVPSRVRFRYRLSPLDDAWQEGEDRRQASYSNLRPGLYQFEVIAANNDGLWGDTAKSLWFVIAPRFFQTTWFFVLCAFALAASFVLLFYWRIRLAAEKLHGRFEERAKERENIARDLHDTLIQGIQGLLLRLQTLSSGLGEGDATREALGEAIDDARDVVIEGRNRITSLRADEDDHIELVESVHEIGEALASKYGMAFEFRHSGAPQKISAAVLKEVLDIVREALRNAFMHSEGSLVQADVICRRRMLTIVIRDDGKGIENKSPQQARQGHFGLVGMHERAEKVGARLALQSVLGAGTELRVELPARMWRGRLRE